MFNVRLERMSDVEVLMTLKNPMISPKDFDWIQKHRHNLLIQFWELSEIMGKRLSPHQKSVVTHFREEQRQSREDALMNQVEAYALRIAKLRDVLTGLSLLLPDDDELLTYVKGALEET